MQITGLKPAVTNSLTTDSNTDNQSLPTVDQLDNAPAASSVETTVFLKHRRKKTVVRLLNEAGHRTRKGGRFTSKTVTRLLQDPTAKGIHRANYTTRNGQTKQWSVKPEVEWVETPVESIVSAEVWDECNKLIAQSAERNSRPTKRPVHVFAGVASCHCGEKMYVPSNSPKYVCHKCRNKIPIEDLEGIFCHEIEAFSVSGDEVGAYLRNADQELTEKEQLLRTQQSEFAKIEKEIARVYRLHQEDQPDIEAFGRFFKPLDERRKQLEKSIPKLEAEIDLRKMNNIWICPAFS